jgi:hypothetical protein
VAAIHYARAAERALETGRTVAALEHAARGLSCGPDPTTEAWLLSVGARGRRVRGGR